MSKNILSIRQNQDPTLHRIGFYALPIADTIEAYIFNGVEDLHTDYPTWMEGPVVDNFLEVSRFNQGFMIEHIEPQLDDVFLCNKRGEVRIISQSQLMTEYVLVDGESTMVGLTSDCIEAVVFEGAGYGDWNEYPLWLQRVLTEDAYYVDGVLMFQDWALCPSDIFLRNKQGYIRIMSDMDFQNFYYLAVDLLPF